MAQQHQSKVELRIVILEIRVQHCCDCDLVFLHRSSAQCFNPLGVRRSHVCCELE